MKKTSLFYWGKLILRFLYSSIFIVSGTTKLFSFASTLDAIYKFRLLPNKFILPFTILLIAIEIIIGLLILFDWNIKIPIVISLFLLTIFSGAVAIGFLQGKKIDCGCFGSILTSQIGLAIVFRNIMFFIIGCTLLFLEYNRGTFKNE